MEQKACSSCFNKWLSKKMQGFKFLPYLWKWLFPSTLIHSGYYCTFRNFAKLAGWKKSVPCCPNQHVYNTRVRCLFMSTCPLGCLLHGLALRYIVFVFFLSICRGLVIFTKFFLFFFFPYIICLTLHVIFNHLKKYGQWGLAVISGS